MRVSAIFWPAAINKNYSPVADGRPAWAAWKQHATRPGLADQDGPRQLPKNIYKLKTSQRTGANAMPFTCVSFVPVYPPEGRGAWGVCDTGPSRIPGRATGPGPAVRCQRRAAQASSLTAGGSMGKKKLGASY